MIIKEYQKEYKDYFMFITVHHSLIEVSVHSYKDDNFRYANKFIDYSVEEVYEAICYRIDNNDLSEVA
jgi:hypothetical protein|tara:strand:- start:989 stop:1192 length:204 start_codon:yes stop_codon:yes gene_type:complete